MSLSACKRALFLIYLCISHLNSSLQEANGEENKVALDAKVSDLDYLRSKMAENFEEEFDEAVAAPADPLAAGMCA